jgi:hypothetical protein
VSTYAPSPAAAGGVTSFVVTDLDDASLWRVFEGEDLYARARILDRRTLELTCSVGEHHFRIQRGNGAA